MTLRARVGRHKKDGRQCQNFADDQRKVIDMLNRIPVSEGGAGGSLNGPVVPGICSDALYRAISKFEEKNQYYPDRRKGFIEPGEPLLKRMEELANPEKPKPAAQIGLDVLRRNVQDVKGLAGKWSAGDRIAMDALVAMAVKHIDNLKKLKDKNGKPLETLPFWAELFGRAVLVNHGETVDSRHRGGVLGVPAFNRHLEVVDWRGNGRRVQDLMNYGTACGHKQQVATWEHPALVLFYDGPCCFVPPGAWGSNQIALAEAHEQTKYTHGNVVYARAA
jgi:hypothetical protein